MARADPDPEAASAFIEMAARLVEMKSYLLLPRSEEGERMKQAVSYTHLDVYKRQVGVRRFAAQLLNEGKIQLFCADSVDGEGVLNLSLIHIWSAPRSPPG